MYDILYLSKYFVLLLWRTREIFNYILNSQQFEKFLMIIIFVLSIWWCPQKFFWLKK